MPLIKGKATAFEIQTNLFSGVFPKHVCDMNPFLYQYLMNQTGRQTFKDQWGHIFADVTAQI